MSSFFHMPRREISYLSFLCLFSAASFLPVWREIHVAGMALFGWLMAALMVLSPALALVLLAREKKANKDQSVKEYQRDPRSVGS